MSEGRGGAEGGGGEGGDEASRARGGAVERRAHLDPRSTARLRVAVASDRAAASNPRVLMRVVSREVSPRIAHVDELNPRRWSARGA